MYWWRLEPLRRALAAGEIGQREQFRYLLAYLLIHWIGWSVQEATDGALAPYHNAVLVLAEIVGAVACYVATKRGDNGDFLVRYLVLYLPIWVRLTLLHLAVYTVLQEVGLRYGGDLGLDDDLRRLLFSSARLNVSRLVLLAVFSTVQFVWMYREMRRLAGRERTG